MKLLYVENCIWKNMDLGLYNFVNAWDEVEGLQKYIKEEKDQYISARVSANILCEVVWMVLII